VHILDLLPQLCYLSRRRATPRLDDTTVLRSALNRYAMHALTGMAVAALTRAAEKNTLGAYAHCSAAWAA
jgi:hypothetical protein